MFPTREMLSGASKRSHFLDAQGWQTWRFLSGNAVATRADSPEGHRAATAKDRGGYFGGFFALARSIASRITPWRRGPFPRTDTATATAKD
jgi:hypothetical protein